MSGQLGGNDLARISIRGEMQLAPHPTRLGSVPLDQPFSRPTQPQPVLSTSKCTGRLPLCIRGSSSDLARRLNVLWSGTARSRL
jgi:hypothetical protein